MRRRRRWRLRRARGDQGKPAIVGLFGFESVTVLNCRVQLKINIPINTSESSLTNAAPVLLFPFLFLNESAY
jgi:hypothetical protein